MAKVSISEAAKLAGISRSYLYRKYIKAGEISVERDNDNNPVIDTAEIIRVFGRIAEDSEQATQNRRDYTPENDAKTAALQTEIQLLREQLTTSQEDKKWLQGKVDQLTGQLDATTRLLEHRPQTEPRKQGFFGFFARLFQKELTS